MGMVDSVAETVLDQAFGNQTAYSPPGTYHVGLSTTTPTNSGGNFTEPVQASYGRVAIANNKSTFEFASAGNLREVRNLIVVQFLLAAENWDGPLTHFGLFSATTGGTPIDWGPLVSAVLVTIGDRFEFPALNMALRLTQGP